MKAASMHQREMAAVHVEACVDLTPLKLTHHRTVSSSDHLGRNVAGGGVDWKEVDGFSGFL